MEAGEVLREAGRRWRRRRGPWKRWRGWLLRSAGDRRRLWRLPKQPWSVAGWGWLRRWDRGDWKKPSPIGLYFARLWYYEELYPMIFTVGALGRAVEACEIRGRDARGGQGGRPPPPEAG